MDLANFLILFSLLHACLGQALKESYDFIIVGAGVGGCTVASRLSEGNKYSVLLVEAGDYPDPGMDIPAFGGRYIGSGKFTRTYLSVPQHNVALENNGTIRYLTGRTMGGGSAVNGMAYAKGHPRDYSIWALLADSSWSYQNMMKYYKKVENYVGDFSSELYGNSGPITVSRPKYAPGVETVYEAGRFLGYPIADPSGPQQISFTPRDYTKKNGRRVSSFTGYLKPVLGSRQNLEILTKALVKRVTIEGNRATKVHYILQSNSADSTREFSVKADKEIILAGGVLESPTILMRSGVGPRDVLYHSKISPVKYLPVGRNLQDHVLVRLEFEIKDTDPSQVMIMSRDLTPAAFELYNTTGDGPYSSLDGLHAQAFLASSIAVEEGTGDWADLQVEFIMGPGRAANPESVPADKVAVTAVVFLVRPKSVGKLVLNRTDPNNDPLIDFRYLTHPRDLEALLDGIKQTLQIYEETPAFQRLEAKYRREELPNCDHLIFRSDSYWKCFIRQKLRSGIHGVGTCSIGKGFYDRKAVLDTNLKVIGIDGLRVADGSAIPFVPNANTQAPIYALSEKAAENILQSWN